MATKRQTRTNRQNARHSSGPKTDEGLAVASMNAIKHGLTARTALLSAEDEESFTALRAALLEDLAPRGALEAMLAENVINAGWQLRRADGVESTVLDHGLAKAAAARNGREQAELAAAIRRKTLGLTDTATRHPAEAELATLLNDENNAEAQAFARLADQEAALELVFACLEAQPGYAFMGDAAGPDALGKLSRYQTAAQRRFHGALSEYRRARPPAEVIRRAGETCD